MIRAGLTGGIASGKSQVSKALRELGAYVIDADEIAREAVRPGTEAFREVVARFGSGILGADGAIDRAELGRRVFGDPRQREALERIVHPRVFAAQEAAYDRIVRADADAVVVFDAALLIETGAHRRMDKVIVVYADEETQLQRLMARDRLPADEARRRIASQAPFPEKKRHADYLIDGTAPLEEVVRRTRTIFEELKTLAAARP